MKFTCDRIKLASKLKTVCEATGSGNTLEVLKGIRVVADETNGTLQLDATDLEIAIRAKVEEVRVTEGGSAVIDGKLFFEIVNKLPDSALTISVDTQSNRATFQSLQNAKAKYTIPVFQAADFPTKVIEVSEQSFFKVPCSVLRNIIKQTIYATIPNESTQLFKAGVLLAIKGNHLRAVACDVNRLSLCDITLPGDSSIDILSVLIPSKLFKKVVGIFNEGDDLIISSDNRELFIKSEGGTVYASVRLLMCQYPMYEKLINFDTEGEAIINRNKLISTLERMQLIDRSVIIKILGDSMIIGRKVKTGSAVEELKLISKNGADLVIGFNNKFVTEYLKSIDSDEVTFKYINGQKPTLWMASQNYHYIVMPIKLDNEEANIEEVA